MEAQPAGEPAEAAGEQPPAQAAARKRSRGGEEEEEQPPPAKKAASAAAVAQRARPDPVQQLQQALFRAEQEKVAALALQAALFASETRRLTRLVEQTLPVPPPGHSLALPDGWVACPTMGALCCDLLVPCKVPLGARFGEVLPEAARWTPAAALRSAAGALPPGHKHRVVVGAVDLTKTRRYYSEEEMEGPGRLAFPNRATWIASRCFWPRDQTPT